MLNKYVIPDKNICSRMIDGEIALLNLKDNSLYFLNSTGTVIWNLANGKTKISKIVDNIVKAFDIDYQNAQKDTFDFIRRLSKEKMLNVYDKPKASNKS